MLLRRLKIRIDGGRREERERERESIFSFKKKYYDECIIYCLVRVGKS